MEILHLQRQVLLLLHQIFAHNLTQLMAILDNLQSQELIFKTNLREHNFEQMIVN